jgi:hypothetical protein
VGNDKSASGVESTKIPAGPVPARSDHSPRCGSAVCSSNTAPSSAPIRVPVGTESAPVHRRLDGKVGRTFAEGRAVQETESHSPLLSASRHPKMTLGLKPVPQILPALLIERRRTPLVIPDAPVQTSIPAFTQSGTGMVRIWPPLPARSAMTQCSSLCWMSSNRKAVNSARRRPQPRRIASVA